MELPKSQQLVYDYISKYHEKHRISPVFREIADGIGMSVGAVQGAVTALIGRKLLKQIPNSPRSFVPLKEVNAD
jgi:hypothetical protein